MHTLFSDHTHSTLITPSFAENNATLKDQNYKNSYFVSLELKVTDILCDFLDLPTIKKFSVTYPLLVQPYLEEVEQKIFAEIMTLPPLEVLDPFAIKSSLELISEKINKLTLLGSASLSLQFSAEDTSHLLYKLDFNTYLTPNSLPNFLNLDEVHIQDEINLFLNIPGALSHIINQLSDRVNILVITHQQNFFHSHLINDIKNLTTYSSLKVLRFSNYLNPDIALKLFMRRNRELQICCDKWSLSETSKVEAHLILK